MMTSVAGTQLFSVDITRRYCNIAGIRMDLPIGFRLAGIPGTPCPLLFTPCPLLQSYYHIIISALFVNLEYRAHLAVIPVRLVPTPSYRLS